MLILKSFALFFAFILTSGATQAAAPQGTAPATSVDENILVLCKLRGEVRTLRLRKDDDKYVTVYRKNQRNQVVGRATYRQSGLQIVQDIRKNLEGSGWACREDSNSQISNHSNTEEIPVNN